MKSVVTIQSDHVMNNPDRKVSGLGTPRKRASASQNARKQQGVGFTFVDQSDDLRSLADKRIVSKDQRHVIRSHVMRSVRHAENEQGVKRPTGRDGTRKLSNPSELFTNIPFDTTQDSTPISDISLSTDNFPRSISISPTDTSPELTLVRSPSSSRLDPFCTLPCGTADGFVIENLMRYCFDVFIPMTFPVESKSLMESTRRRGKILQSKTSRPATFFGMMSVVAAHRAITSGRHHDLIPSDNNHDELLIDRDFRLMKQYTLVNTRARIAEDAPMDEDIIEAVFSLVGAATMIGNFEEARIHLKGVKGVLSRNGSAEELSQPASAWIPLYDVNCALGTLSRPLFRLPWESTPVPQNILQRIEPPQGTSLQRIGSGFKEIAGLSYRLLDVLRVARIICFFCEFNTKDSQGLNAEEHEVFRQKTLELQYDLLSYVYEGSPSQGEILDETIELSPVEQVVRLAVLGMCSTSITRILPNGGLGRALTTHQKLAIHHWFETSKQAPDYHTARLGVWAQFIFMLGAKSQTEAKYFGNILNKMLQHMKLTSWEELEDIFLDFLYIPSLQAKEFRRLWNNISARRSQSKTPPSNTSVVQ